MRYVVAWPKASFYVVDSKGKGYDVVVERGGDVPDGVDQATIEALRVCGALIPGEANAPDPLSTAGDPAVVLEVPIKSAKVGVWREFALAQGMDAAEVKKARKDQLIERYFVEPPEPTPPVDPSVPPAIDADDDAWRAYAIAQGVDEADAAAATRDQLIALYADPS